MELIEMITRPEHPWTLILVSNDPLIMAACDRVILMDEGRIARDDSFSNLMKEGVLNDIIS